MALDHCPNCVPIDWISLPIDIACLMPLKALVAKPTAVIGSTMLSSFSYVMIKVFAALVAIYKKIELKLL